MPSNIDEQRSVPPLRSVVITPEIKAEFARQRAEEERRQAMRPQIDLEGHEALMRLFKVAQADTGQCKYIAAFLLGLYNGYRFPFDMTNFRAIDGALFDDCIAVLKMDARPRQEVHRYFDDGSRKFEQLAKDWGIEDALQLREMASRVADTNGFS